MRCAVFTVTEGGARLSEKVAAAMPSEADVWVKEKYATLAAGNRIFYNDLKEAVKNAFAVYDALIFIAATGIAVRLIAPHIVSKLADPAVIVVDERGQHVISLLSGHMGGANELTRKLAAALNSDAVITTATDVYEKVAVDAIAAKLALDPWPKDNIKHFNKALLDGEKINWILAEDLRQKDFWRERLREAEIAPEMKAELSFIPPLVILTDKIPGQEKKYIGCSGEVPDGDKGQGFKLFLIPRRLIAGVGCRRGTAAAEILAALSQATATAKRNLDFIDAIVSAEIKADEPGIKDAAKKIGAKLYFTDVGALNSQIERYRLARSPFVEKTVGAGNVCEAATLDYWHNVLHKSERGRFALGKTKYGKVTVALLWLR